jgi:uncharacterized repeat protein (TIGR01451 family)
MTLNANYPQRAMLLLLCGVADAQAVPAVPPTEIAVSPTPPSPSVTITTTAEKIETAHVQGHAPVRLLPADHVVAGDEVIYTLEVRNVGPAPVDDYTFTTAIPSHMVYVADSAVAPGADVSYSVDGGRSYDAPEKLMVHGANGKQRPAVAADYTHIRWIMRNRLNRGSMALARFRAVLR